VLAASAPITKTSGLERFVLTLNPWNFEGADRILRNGPFRAQAGSLFSAVASRSRRPGASSEESRAAPAGAFPKGSKTRATMFRVTGGQFMNAAAPSSLGSEILARRLRELAGEERNVHVDFLLHLDEFDRRRAFLEAGYESLWTYCLRALRLREGPAARRIGAMRVLRRFAALEAALRDGRLCLSTVTLIGPLLTSENLTELVDRAANRTKAEVEQLVVSLQPRVAPKDGVRKVPQRSSSSSSPGAAKHLATPCEVAAAAIVANSASTPGPADAALGNPKISTEASAMANAAVSAPAREIPLALSSDHDLRREPPRPELRPVAADEYSLRVTIDADFKADLDTLKSLLSHTTGGDLLAVLREALRCGIEKHGKRRGAVKPDRERATTSPGKNAGRAKSAAAVTGVIGSADPCRRGDTQLPDAQLPAQDTQPRARGAAQPPAHDDVVPNARRDGRAIPHGDTIKGAGAGGAGASARDDRPKPAERASDSGRRAASGVGARRRVLHVDEQGWREVSQPLEARDRSQDARRARRHVDPRQSSTDLPCP
jgi:hypothetical protein